MALQKIVDSMRDVTVVDAAKITTGAVPAAALTNVDLVEGTKGADIASAGTMVIGTDGGYFDITGTTGISTMTVAAGRVFTLQFDGVVTLTHSATLYLSGAANFTTEANDHMTFISVAANSVRQIGTGLKDGGSPVVAAGGGWEFVSSATASNSASLAFTNMVIGYDYQYVEDSIFHATNATSHIAVLGIAGPTYRTTNYLTTTVYIDNAGGSHSYEFVYDIRMVANVNEDMGNQTNEALYRYVLDLSDPAGTTNRTSFSGEGVLYGGSPANVPLRCTGFYNGASEAHTSIKFSSSSGNLVSGTIYQYRRTRS